MQNYKEKLINKKSGVFLFLIFIVQVSFAQLCGFVSVGDASGNVSFFYGQPFYEQYEIGNVSISNGMAEAQMITRAIVDDTCQNEGYNKYGFVYSPSTPAGTYSDSHYSRSALYNYDSITTFDLTIYPVYDSMDTMLRFSNNLGTYHSGLNTYYGQSVHGCDSNERVMVYAVEPCADIDQTAGYSVEEMTIPLQVAVSPNHSVVQRTHNPATTTFRVGTTTPVDWTVSVAGDTLTCTQNLILRFPPCGSGFTAQDAYGERTIYNTVRIGANCWTRENSRATMYSNSPSPIMIATPYESAQFSNTTENVNTYGRLYSFYSAVNLAEGSSDAPVVGPSGHVQGICPNGWHLPTGSDFLGVLQNEYESLITPDYWLSPGNNATEFSVLPSGFYNPITRRFERLLVSTYFWTITTESSVYLACEFGSACGETVLVPKSKDYRFSVRCLKD